MSDKPQYYDELAALREENARLMEALQLARRRICDIIDANPDVSPTNQAASRTVNEMDIALATVSDIGE